MFISGTRLPISGAKLWISGATVWISGTAASNEEVDRTGVSDGTLSIWEAEVSTSGAKDEISGLKDVWRKQLELWTGFKTIIFQKTESNTQNGSVLRTLKKFVTKNRM